MGIGNIFGDFVDLLNGVDRRRQPSPPPVPQRPSYHTNTYAAPPPPVPERPSYDPDAHVAPPPPPRPAPRPVPPPPRPRNQYGTYYTETEYTQGIQIIPIPYETPTRDQSEDPTVMYHGTPEIASAYDIYQYNRWLVGTGHGNQAGIYMTPEFDEAANSYAKEDGAIIMLYVDPTWGKEKTTSTYYVFVIPNPQEGAFYGIGAIDPLGVLGKDGQRIA